MSHQIQQLGQSSGKDRSEIFLVQGQFEFSSQNPSMIKDTILRWCQDLTQFYKVSESYSLLSRDD